MDIHDDAYIATVSTDEVNIEGLEQILLRKMKYIDVDYDFGEMDVPEMAYNILDRLCTQIQGFSFCDPGRARNRLWRKIREQIRLLNTLGMSVFAGEEDSIACVRIISTGVACGCFDKLVEVEVPREGARVLRGLDAWMDAVIPTCINNH